MNVLEIEDLQVSFDTPGGEVRAVDRVSFRVPAGKTVALVGESGSGKTVVSQAILGLIPKPGRISGGEIRFRDPATGTPVRLDTLDTRGPEMRQIRGGRISIIFQEPMTALSPLHTIGDQIGEAIRLHVADAGGTVRERVVELLELVGFPDAEHAPDSYTFELSGGLRQRAVIAMALACNPALVIADEPTTALDVTIQAQILQLLRSLQDRLGMAILLITHDLGVVANMADEVVVVYRGRVVESGTATDVFNSPGHAYTRALHAAVPRFDMEPDDRLVPIRPIAPHPEGFLSANGQAPAAEAPDPVLVRLEGVTKHFTKRRGRGLFSPAQARAFTAVDDISLDVRRGECLGLVGESGCGKTTLSKMVMRAITPDTGRITIALDGGHRDVHGLSGAELDDFRRRVQLIFQDPFSSLNPRMTVHEILTEPYVIHGRLTPAERTARAEELMRIVGLRPEHLRRYPHSFSGGQRQRIGIARALALKPELILCDEPVSALDVSVQAQVLNLLKDLKEQMGLTYLFVSHNLAVVDYMADRIAVMCAGRIVEIAPADTLVKDHRHPYTRALFAAVPEPDLARPLDLGALMAGKTSDPTAWPEPYRLAPEGPAAALVEVAPGHRILMAGTQGMREQVA
ncbi:MAG: ABC transporter ATP-binding protein [Alphaproteobacteria bacterium]|nr:ABC transporter ATP-binding protein [Alphaproteobacteria bacterium]MDX5368592.1 ABC transporter ATP-binding protein [Alphaproteobacteria bacterium]MDX5463337.1 ABC transporter ATP-binding protein [Alphaproteobacteria bacterium]